MRDRPYHTLPYPQNFLHDVYRFEEKENLSNQREKAKAKAFKLTEATVPGDFKKFRVLIVGNYGPGYNMESKYQDQVRAQIQRNLENFDGIGAETARFFDLIDEDKQETADLIIHVNLKSIDPNCQAMINRHHNKNYVIGQKKIPMVITADNDQKVGEACLNHFNYLIRKQQHPYIELQSALLSNQKNDEKARDSVEQRLKQLQEMNTVGKLLNELIKKLHNYATGDSSYYTISSTRRIKANEMLEAAEVARKPLSKDSYTKFLLQLKKLRDDVEVDHRSYCSLFFMSSNLVGICDKYLESNLGKELLKKALPKNAIAHQDVKAAQLSKQRT